VFQKQQHRGVCKLQDSNARCAGMHVQQTPSAVATYVGCCLKRLADLPAEWDVVVCADGLASA
jgi:hypothetical protein